MGGWTRLPRGEEKTPSRLLQKTWRDQRDVEAEREGFEPSDQVDPGHGFSKPAHSTTLPPLLLSINDCSQKTYAVLLTSIISGSLHWL